jgi:hypothetical protein
VSKQKRKTQRRPNPPAGGSPETRRAESGAVSGGGEFKPNYAYVVKDLRRIGLLAGSLILGLIILSFFLK